MLTQRKTQRKTLVQEANRAGSRVAAQAREVASGAGEVARTATSELGGFRRRGRRRADGKVARARHAAASRLQGTASRLSSAADVVENGRHKPRRWPRVAALVGVVVAAGVLVATRVRSMWSRDATTRHDPGTPDSTGGTEGPQTEAQGAVAGEPTAKTKAAQGASSGGTTSGGARRSTATSAASTARDNGGR